MGVVLSLAPAQERTRTLRFRKETAIELFFCICTFLVSVGWFWVRLSLGTQGIEGEEFQLGLQFFMSVSRSADFFCKCRSVLPLNFVEGSRGHRHYRPPSSAIGGWIIKSFCLPPASGKAYGAAGRLRLARRERRSLAQAQRPRCSSIQNLMTVKKRSGLSSEKRVRRVLASKASPNAMGRIRVILWPKVGC
jgi:hypothetical protein